MFHPLALIEKLGIIRCIFTQNVSLKSSRENRHVLPPSEESRPPKMWVCASFPWLFVNIILRFHGFSVMCDLAWGALKRIFLRNCLALVICALSQGQTVGQRLLTLIIPSGQSCDIMQLKDMWLCSRMCKRERALFYSFVMNCTHPRTTNCLTFFSFA